MFERLETTNDSLNIGATKTHLRKLGRKDIIDDINEVMGKDRDRLSGKLSEITHQVIYTKTIHWETNFRSNP